MAIDLDEQYGQTPLDLDEKAGLIPEHLTIKGDLNDWEQENLLPAVRWLKRVRSPDVLSEGFCRELHQQMFGKTWSGAGTFRKSDKNIGCDRTQVAVRLNGLFGNTRWWVDNATFPPDEIAARFHRDLVWIHPFPNGNRHSRMMADALLRRMGQAAFSWGSGGDLVAANEVRARYLAALRAADQGDYQLLLAFVRS
ncbi:mobile mystery protein B [Roseateles terrae]|uniref:Fic-DOC domain mobile mystery protein B n=1 Tax=Roseateles terrae TaxID=431060 RepID=A0ABR6GXP6_9BURK|nr:mobile mystery protein B [Roseateles terrae]MBB3196883.1 Fic-DOC domain mobile mystery protein B [Roseateles terrae]OWQ84568.1 cell filamentation protein Fic [Roseateles terrae]